MPINSWYWCKAYPSSVMGLLIQVSAFSTLLYCGGYIFAITSPMEKCITLFFDKTWISVTKVYFVLRVVKIGQLVFEKMVLKFRQCIFYYCFVNIHFDKIWISYTHWRSTLANWCLYFLYHHPFEKDVTRHLNKLECPLCHVWLELTLWLWSRNYLFLEKDMTLTWTIINFLHLRMLCAKFG